MSHSHAHEHPHEHDDEHTHAHHHSHGHGHDHSHGSGGLIGIIGAALHLPGFGHDHDHGYTELAADTALHDNALGIRTVWLALFVLGITTILQIIIYLASGSVALLADTVHNLGDALNSLPLLVAFYLARRAPTRRYTYGFGRAEDIAGVFIVISIAFSAGYILIESFQKLINPEPLTHLPWVAAAAMIGFVGNELVALMQIRVGRQIGSDAMIADGQHARVDGLTSLAVLIAVLGTALGFPIVDPIIGIVIAFAIVGITWNAIKAVWFRLMDAVDPHTTAHLAQHMMEVDGVGAVVAIRAHWVGHRLNVEALVAVDGTCTVAESQAILRRVYSAMQHTVPQIGAVTLQTAPYHPMDTPGDEAYEHPTQWPNPFGQHRH